MVLAADRQRVKTLLTETITLLCKNGLHFKSGFSIEALIGITLDEDDVFLVSIKETIQPATSGLSDSKQRNVVDTDLPADQEVILDDSQGNDTGLLGFEGTLGKTKFATKRSAAAGGRKNLHGKLRLSPEIAAHTNLRSSFKRRVSESSDTDVKIADNEDCNHIGGCSSERLYPSSSNLSEDFTNKELFRQQENDDPGCMENEDNGMMDSVPRESHEFVSVKQEPDSDESFQESEPMTVDMGSVNANMESFSADPSFLKHPSYVNWNDYSHFQQQEFISSNKSNSSLVLPNDDLVRSGHQSSQARPHRCSKCNKCFTTVQGRNLHEKLHDGIYQYNCPHCGKGCSGTTQLRGHMATHTQVKEFKCPICGHAYVYKKTLTDHIKRMHMEILTMPIM